MSYSRRDLTVSRLMGIVHGKLTENGNIGPAISLACTIQKVWDSHDTLGAREAARKLLN